MKYVIPNRFDPDTDTRFLFRPLIVTDRAVLTASVNEKILWRKTLKFVRPAEMITAEISADTLPGAVVFDLEESK